jgi:hypothetical protein
MREYNKKEFKRADVRMEVIEESIKQEIKDRIVESDEQIYVVKNELSGIITLSIHTYYRTLKRF